MHILLLVVHVIVCAVLIVSILMQAGRGGGLAGGAFGGMGGGSQVFGGTGAATFLQKVTTYTAVLFFFTCIGLWYTGRTGESLPETASERLLQEQGAPVPLQQSAPQALPGTETAPATPADTTSGQ